MTDSFTTVVIPDFSDELSLFEEGEFLCTILGFEVKTSHAGTKYVSWKLKANNNNIVFHATPIQGRGAGMFKHFVHAAGKGEYESGPIDLKELEGRQLMGELIVDEYEVLGQKKKKLKVKNVWLADNVLAAEQAAQELPF